MTVYELINLRKLAIQSKERAGKLSHDISLAAKEHGVHYSKKEEKHKYETYFVNDYPDTFVPVMDKFLNDFVEAKGKPETPIEQPIKKKKAQIPSVTVIQGVNDISDFISQDSINQAAKDKRQAEWLAKRKSK